MFLKRIILALIVLFLVGMPVHAQNVQNLGVLMPAMGPAFLPSVGTILWQQTAEVTGNVVDLNVGWNQGWNCLGTDGDNSDPNNYPALNLVDQTQHQKIGTVNVCESGSPCYTPQAYSKNPLWTGPIQVGDLIVVKVAQQGVNCQGGQPWPECSNGTTCGGGVIFINANLVN